MIRVKRTYEPAARQDGRRVLVERLWPRGMKKEALAADAWCKEVAPSTELRKWFDHRVERWEEFRRRYEEELDANREAWTPLLEAAGDGTLTLLFSAHDTDHNGAIVLRDYLTRRASRTRSKRTTTRTGPRKAARGRSTAKTPARKPATKPAKKSAKKSAKKPAKKSAKKPAKKSARS